MECVACKQPMIVLELEQIEIDYCLDCGGVWLDAGELELLLENHDKVSQILEKAATGRKEGKGRKCPICLKRMLEIAVGSDSDVHIDHCREGHGIWFDRGELKAIAEITGSLANGRVAGLLQDIFGEKKNIE